MDESRFMFDQLAVLSPVMLALTAATPVLKGRLVDTDVRWDTIANAVDDRTEAERGLLNADPVSGVCVFFLFLVFALCLVMPVDLYFFQLTDNSGHVERGIWKYGYERGRMEGAA